MGTTRMRLCIEYTCAWLSHAHRNMNQNQFVVRVAIATRTDCARGYSHAHKDFPRSCLTQKANKIELHRGQNPLSCCIIVFFIQGVPQNSLRFLFSSFSAQDAARIFILDIFQQPFPLAVGNCPKF